MDRTIQKESRSIGINVNVVRVCCNSGQKAPSPV